ncbi:hypothetical protein L6019_RS23625 [Escherichia coli]|nr:hypothetical protein [Escherichia coli]EKG7113543.1 hypothetical protein [Escherichia coli]EKR4921315.1 hypothetical protein [Escherichia coli]ELM8776636.1 hypothetical protein [Escherichia coli]EMA4402933.1 hypothetical protein [Escherichia coli]
MTAFISIMIVALIVTPVALYARAAYLRRRFMLDQVMQFLNSPAATISQKTIARHAFLDALSISLPLKVLAAHKHIQESVNSREFKEFIKLCEEDTESQRKLTEIVDMMFRINVSFNLPLHIYASMKRCSVTKKVSPEIKKAYAEFRHQHQM